MTSFRFLLTILFAITSIQVTLASELWSDQGIKIRQYVSLTLKNNKIVLKHYAQERGDYQQLIESLTFEKESEAIEYIQVKYSEMKPVSALEHWEISTFDSEDEFKRTRNKVLWDVRHQWSEEWEIKYAEWIQKSVSEDFFQKFGLSTDCADAVVGLRWIFSRINGLPVGNTLADTSNLFTNYSMPRKWKKIPTANDWNKDQLFLTALNYVMDLSSTRTIIRDAYPVSLTRNGLRVGTFVLTQNQESNHVKLISENHFDDPFGLPLYTLSSTTPRQIRLLVREVMADQDWPVQGVKSFMAFRWPVANGDNIHLLGINKHKYFSEEQFDPDLKEQNPVFIQFVLSRVKDNYDPQNLIENGIADITQYLEARLKVVADGFAFCSRNGCPEGSGSWDDWSTPSRDSKLLKKFKDLELLVSQFEDLNPGLTEKWNWALKNNSFKVEGISITYFGLYYLFQNNLTSSNPNHSIENRWGISYKKVLTQIFEAFEKLLVERLNQLQSRSEVCANDNCFPKTDLWVKSNTFHIDSKLKRLYFDFKNYCLMFNLNDCAQVVRAISDKLFSNGIESQSLATWMEKAPFFHSDPTSSISRSWGDLNQTLNGTVLSVSKSLKVARNQLALIDGQRIFDLTKSEILVEVTEDQNVYLTKEGNVFRFLISSRTLQRLNEKTWETISIDQELLLNTKINVAPVLKEINQSLYFIFKGQDQDQLGHLSMAQLKSVHSSLINGIQFSDDGILIKDNDQTLILDLNLNKEIDLDFVAQRINLDVKKLNLKSYSYPFAIFEYYDQDNDRQFPVLVNIDNQKVYTVGFGRAHKIKLTWSSAKLQKLIVEELVSEEFPQSFALSFNTLDKLESTPLDQLVKDIVEDQNVVYFASLKGGRWDQDLETSFYQWKTLQPARLASVNGLIAQAIFKSGLYFSSTTVGKAGTLLSFDGSRQDLAPSFLDSTNSFCQSQSNGQDIFTFRLSSFHGDYNCMGNALVNGDPQLSISLNSWGDSENQLDRNWSTRVRNFEIESGLVDTFGIGLVIYWSVNKDFQ